MPVSKEDILKTAELAKIYLDKKDIEEIYPHLNFIMDMMDKVKKLDKENANFYFVNLKQLRPDKDEKHFHKEDILKNSKETKDGYFTVSKMME